MKNQGGKKRIAGGNHQCRRNKFCRDMLNSNMEAFDKYINSVITPKSVGAGVGTVFLTFFTSKFAPKLPSKFYDLLDNTLVRIVLTAYLINYQIHAPSLSVLISMIIVIGFEVLVKIFAPETPSLAELVKSTTEEESGNSGGGKGKSSEGCNCYCGHTIYAENPKDETRHPKVIDDPNKVNDRQFTSSPFSQQTKWATPFA